MKNTYQISCICAARTADTIRCDAMMMAINNSICDPLSAIRPHSQYRLIVALVLKFLFVLNLIGWYTSHTHISPHFHYKKKIGISIYNDWRKYLTGMIYIYNMNSHYNVYIISASAFCVCLIRVFHFHCFIQNISK